MGPVLSHSGRNTQTEKMWLPKRSKECRERTKKVLGTPKKSGDTEREKRGCDKKKVEMQRQKKRRGVGADGKYQGMKKRKG